MHRVDHLTRRVAAGLLAAVGFALCGWAVAQTYPTKPIRYIVPFGPGTGSDVLGRVIALKLSEQMGQSVVIDNRPGASGAVGTEMGAKAAPDGYTLTLATNATMITYPNLTTVNYRVATDFVPVALFARTSMLLVTANQPANPKSVAELIAQTRAKRISFASNGAGTIGHLTSELFLRKSGLEATHVAYKGSGQSHTDVIRGELLFMVDTPVATLPQVRGGRMRALAVTGNERLPTLPDVPTFAEAGVPDLRLYAWWGTFAPKQTPAAIVRRLHDETLKAVQAPETTTRLKAMELEQFQMPVAKYAGFIEEEWRFWQGFLRQSGIRLDP